MKRKTHSLPAKSSLGKLLTIGISAASFALVTAPQANAASDTWTGASDALWSNTGNWNPSVAVPGAGDTATFNAGSSNTTIDLGVGVTLGTLLFDTSSAAAYTVGSGAVGSQTLTLDTLADGVQMNSTVAQDQLINANLALSTTGTYTVGLTNNSTTNTLTVAGGISASSSGAKLLTVTGSGNTAISGAITSGTGTIGLLKSGAGTLTLSNAGTSTIASNMKISGGLLQITAGTINVTENSGDNTGLRQGGNLTVSGGTLNISGGSSWFPIGDTSGQTSTLTVAGGTVNVTNSWGSEVGRAGGGVLTITSGTFRNADTGNIGFILGEMATGAGTVNLNGGTLTVNKVKDGGGTGSSGNKFYFNGGTLSTTGANTTAFFAATTKIDTEVRNGGGTIDTAGFNATIADDIVHSTVGGDNAIDGGLTKTGAGVLTLSGANTYTGATTINAGTLKLANTGSLASTTYTIGAGAIFDVSALASYSLSGKAITLTLDGSSAGSINATGLALDLGGTLTLNLTTGPPAANYALFTATSTTGAFDSINLSGNFSGALVNNSGIWTATSNGYSFTIDQSTGTLSVAAVPEPNVVALIAVGLFGALVFARRRAPRIAAAKF